MVVNTNMTKVANPDLKEHVKNFSPVATYFPAATIPFPALGVLQEETLEVTTR